MGDKIENAIIFHLWPNSWNTYVVVDEGVNTQQCWRVPHWGLYLFLRVDANSRCPNFSVLFFQKFNSFFLLGSSKHLHQVKRSFIFLPSLPFNWIFPLHNQIFFFDELKYLEKNLQPSLHYFFLQIILLVKLSKFKKWRKKFGKIINKINYLFTFLFINYYFFFILQFNYISFYTYQYSLNLNDFYLSFKKSDLS